jgi:hypothetical protein
VEDRICPLLRFLVLHVYRDAPVSKFKLDGQLSTLCLVLVRHIEIDQYVRFFDVQVQDFFVVNLQKSPADLIEDYECGRFIVGLSVLRDGLKRAVLAVL